jgi:methylisocitrate lyase
MNSSTSSSGSTSSTSSGSTSSTSSSGSTSSTSSSGSTSSTSSGSSRASSPGARLRQAWQEPPLCIPGVFAPLVARMAQRLGFRAVYLSGGALSAGYGVPDVGLLSVSEFADEIRRIAAATDLPLLADADTGFGETLNVERTVRLYESAGAAGLHLEDQQLPKRCGHLSGKTLIEPGQMEAKIRAAVAARRDPAFVIIARTDARGVTDLADALKRAERYVAAGADAIFPEALQSVEEFAGFARALPGVPLLANMTEFGKSPLLAAQQLAELGYAMVLYPLTAFRAAMRAAQETLGSLARLGHQRDSLPSMLTRAELYDLLDYTDYEARDRVYFSVSVTPPP